MPKCEGAGCRVILDKYLSFYLISILKISLVDLII